MSIILGIFQLISIIIIVVYEYTQKYISVFMWATLLILFGIPHFIAILFRKCNYSEYTMIRASVFVILFNLIYILSRIIISKIAIKRKCIIHKRK
ncbi:hypothetical protein Q5M85_12095 [Paraclostridium bifermentans]|nr:hypothetical protein [Paraclostridium bifermentans]